jgi:hypothetical protein
MEMATAISLLCVFLLAHYHLYSQELEPRLYAALPKDLNALAIGYGLSRGNVLTDPSLPISDFKITALNASAIYMRTFSLGQKLSRIQLSFPFLYMIGQAQINGRDTSAARSGFGDARLRFSINILGTPAYDRRDFTKYTEKTVLGLSLITSIPTGWYQENKRINIGSNRWAIKPELGISKRIRNIYAEAFAGVWFYTDNHHYLSAKTLEQEPVFSIQGHITYYFKNKMGITLSGTRFNGGKTIVNEVPAGDLLDNWRAGASWSVPIPKGHTLKLQFHTGVFTSRGYDYHIVVLSYSYVFFGKSA